MTEDALFTAWAVGKRVDLNNAAVSGVNKTLLDLYNEAKNMYRVVASTYDDKAAAVQSRNTLRGTYPDAWLLLSK